MPIVQRFRIPRGLDLEDKTQVEDYWIKWGELNIILVDGTMKCIQHYKVVYESAPCEENIIDDE